MKQIMGLAALLTVMGCSSFTPLTVSDIEKRHREGVAEAELVTAIETSGTQYFLRPEQRVSLQGRLPEPVLAAMKPGGTPSRQAVFAADGYWYGNCALAPEDALGLACEPQYAEFLSGMPWVTR